MPLYLLSLSAHTEGHDYAGLAASLQRVGAQQILPGSWIFEVDNAVQALADAITPKLGQSDRYVIVEIAPGAAWAGVRIDRAAGLWLKQRRT
jgi:hypothetical protein